MLKSNIVDPRSGISSRVDKHGNLAVVCNLPDAPQLGTYNTYRYLGGSLGTEGLDAGIINQRVNGSTIEQPFYIESSLDYDIHIMNISILVADGNTSHDKWGALAPLTNGYSLYILESGEYTYILNKVKTIGQLIAYSGFKDGYGSSTTSWELSNWTGSADASTINIPIGDYIPGGLRLGSGTKDRLVSVVSDNFKPLTECWVRVYGYKHYSYMGENNA